MSEIYLGDHVKSCNLHIQLRCAVCVCVCVNLGVDLCDLCRTGFIQSSSEPPDPRSCPCVHWPVCVLGRGALEVMAVF